MVEAREAPRTLGGGVLGQKKTQEPSPLEDHLCAKFHPDLSSRLDFYREQTHPHTDRHCPLCIRFLEVLFLEFALTSNNPGGIYPHIKYVK